MNWSVTCLVLVKESPFCLPPILVEKLQERLAKSIENYKNSVPKKIAIEGVKKTDGIAIFDKNLLSFFRNSGFAEVTGTWQCKRKSPFSFALHSFLRNFAHE